MCVTFTVGITFSVVITFSGDTIVYCMSELLRFFQMNLRDLVANG